MNMRKSSVWCNSAVDVGSTGLIQVDNIPLVMKQPLSIAIASHIGHYDVSTSTAATKILAHRQDVTDKITNLVAHGLSAQLGACLLRTAFTGDPTFAQSCHVFSAVYLEHLDSLCLQAVTRILGIVP
jgi:hypothetical protein